MYQFPVVSPKALRVQDTDQRHDVAKPLWGPVPSDNIPYARDKHFVGREDIMIALERKLNAGNHCRAGLIGFGGMG